MRILIIGAGGHAQVVADILLRMKDAGEGIVPVGYLDDDPAIQGTLHLGLDVLGDLSKAGLEPHEAVVVAVGDNDARRGLFEKLARQGETFFIARHPGAVIAPDVSIGAGTMICAGTVVNPRSSIGRNVILNTACSIDHHNIIGDHVHIAPGVHTGGNVRIGDGTLIGIGAVVMPGRTVGKWCLVGAGSLVHDDIPDGSVAFGIPAEVRRKREKGGPSNG